MVLIIYYIILITVKSVLGSADNDLLLAKNWFVYLSNALEKSTTNQQYMVQYYIKFNKHTMKLMEWCHPHYYHTEVDLWPPKKNLFPFLPCGLVHEIRKRDERIVSWGITVNLKFYVNVTFLRFEIRDNSKDCSSSALKIGAYKHGGWKTRWHWVYCGHRPPWSETIASNQIVMVINQYDMNFRFNVSFIYSIIDGNEYVKVDFQYTDVSPIIHQRFYYEIKHNVSLKWIINLSIGYVSHFTNIIVRNSIGWLYVYDGPKEHYTILALRQGIRDTIVNRVNTTSKYYISIIKFLHQNHNKEIVGVPNIELYFTKKRLLSDTKVHINRRVRIQHNGHILQSVYPISLDTNYTNVTFNIRKFHGWNEGGCNMGGYAIIQELSNANSVLIRSGPYCSGGSSNQPLISDDGLQYIVLSRRKTFLVIYAFGPEYWIDIDLIISTSLCEGFFDFPMICEAVIEISHNRHLRLHVQFGYFQLTCDRSSGNNMTFISIRMLKFTGCVIAQSILYRQQTSYELELLSRIHINIKLQSPLFYVIGNESTHLGAMGAFWRDSITGYPHSEALTSKKKLQIGDVTTLTYRQTTTATHLEVTMVMTIQAHNSGIETNKCEKIVGSRSRQTRQISHKYPIDYIKLTSLCASSFYHKAMSYVYTIVPRFMTYRNHLSNVYFNIQNTDCGNLINMSNAVTITIRRTINQSFRISNNATIQIEVPNVSMFLAFDKHEYCSTSIFHYRVYLTMFHNSTLTSIKEQYFQVFNNLKK